jgi:hypothetical protein
LEKRKQVVDVQNVLDNQREKFRELELQNQKREQEFQKRDEELHNSIKSFEKFYLVDP